MTSAETNLVMTVIGFTVSTLFIVFICTRLICARIHVRAARRTFLNSSRSDLAALEHGAHRIDIPALANFPAKQFSDDYFSSSENAQCAVCLSEYRKEDIVRILPQCRHYFHMNCIDKWLIQNSTCPVCRLPLRSANENRSTMKPLFSSRSYYSIDPSNVHTYQCLLSARRLPSSSVGDQEACNQSPPEEIPSCKNSGDVRILVYKKILLVGTETTSSTLEWAMAEILHDPTKLKATQEELNRVIGRGNLIKEEDFARLPYLQAVLNETFRLHPSLPLLCQEKQPLILRFVTLRFQKIVE